LAGGGLLDPVSDSTASFTVLPPARERTLLFTLAAVQFTHILDFMIMMPLGAQLMRYFDLSPGQFSWLVASYGLAAAVSGFLGGFVLDRFDRKVALLALYGGFVLATLACGLAGSYEALLLARLAAGACGGVAGAVVTAMVGDVIPPERRGRAMGTVMAAFPLASILGIPIGITLAAWRDWHAPFLALAAVAGLVGLVAHRALPRLPRERSTTPPLQQMEAILRHPIHHRAFALSAVLVFAGGLVIPFMAPSLVANVGLTEAQLPFVYFFGGACTFFTMPWLGRLSDRHDKLHVLLAISAVGIVSVLILTRLGTVALPAALLASTFFFVGMAGRFPPAMSMVTNAVEGRYRGGFMSVNAALQQASGGLANVCAGLLITRDVATGRLEGYPLAGLCTVGAFLATVWLAARLRRAAPHAARNPRPVTPVAPVAG
jgi:MFS transporter, DHA1 family, inner membrane transport protein